MGTIVKNKTWADNENVTYTDLNGTFDTIYNEFNGSITNANINSSAAISASKISGTAVTLAGSETLTNKVLTSPTITSPTLQGTIDGWVAANETWTYASATTITVPSGAASKYSKGDKIKLTQTTTKYFYVVGVADTVLTVTGGDDYTVANATITSPYYSKAQTPVGFPGWFVYTPTWAGFNSDPTQTNRFKIDGNACTVYIAAYGNSNASTFTFTLPVATATGIDGARYIFPAVIINNSTRGDTVGVIGLNNESTTANVGISLSTVTGAAFGGFSTGVSSQKGAECTFTYKF